MSALQPPPIEEFMLGNSPAIVAVRRLVLRLARSELPVLIEGPTGAGKELVAQALHTYGGRPGAFVAQNVCAISESMFENEMFGHSRGAYTGAVSDAPGLLAQAHRGTLFLDELGGLALGPQAKLLRAIETREFRRVGSLRPESSDFRVVTATNVPLADFVAQGRFRADFAHRVSAAVVRVPSLHDRREDIPLLAEHFARGRQRLGPGALRALSRMDWQGNIRELRNLVQLAAELSDGPVTAGFIQALRSERSRRSGLLFPESLERARLLEALEAHGWRKGAVAASLGVHVATVYRQIRRHGLDAMW
jgi:DNA-binding NtrC family response regulator